GAHDQPKGIAPLAPNPPGGHPADQPQKIMNRVIVSALFVAALVTPELPGAQGGLPPQPAEPFKVGTFEIRGAPRVGLVLRDSLVIELDPANAALERSPLYPRLPMPADMRGLIAQYEYGLKFRLYEIVNNLV